MSALRPVDTDSRLVLIDASGYLYRAFHAMPPLARASDGHPTGAIAGFCAMLWHLHSAFDATHIAAVFDAGGKNFRHALHPGYKANRPPPPSDLVRQFSPVRRATEALGLAMVEAAGHEADDIIATYTRRASRLGARVTIASSDKDLRQLVGDRVTIYEPLQGQHLDPEAVKARMGVAPVYVADWLALVGDTSDNIPGVPSIGPKTAAALIDAHGPVEDIITAANACKLGARSGLICANAETLRLGKRLALLNDRVPDLPCIPSLAARAADIEGFRAFLAEYELRSLAARIAPSSEVAP